MVSESNQIPNEVDAFADELSRQERKRFFEAVRELEQRQTEALRLFRPLPKTLPALFSCASEILIRGGNRSSKSTTAAAWVASAATGIQLNAGDGRLIPMLHPDPFLIWIFGYGEDHIGGTLYSKLFKPGAFKLIRDNVTQELRVWRPWRSDDALREEETVPAPPLIPRRMIDPKGWAWKKKASRVVEVCRLNLPGVERELRFFTSGGECQQGQSVPIVWIDEDVKIEDHISELRARTGDDRGKLLWSAWPHTDNEALVRMSEWARLEMTKEVPRAYEVVLWFSDNPYIPAPERQRILDGYTDEERLARDKGEFQDGSKLVFPSFDIAVHGLPNPGMVDPLEIELRCTDYRIPDNWCRFLSVDPGHTQPAVVFAAVPPPEVGDYIVIYDEVYQSGLDAHELAAAIKAKDPLAEYEAFIIDNHAARMTAMGFGRTFGSIYSEAFEKAGLKSRLTGSGFAPGSDDVTARNMLVREWLSHKNPRGVPKLRFITANTACVQWEFSHYKKKIRWNEATEEVIKRHDHLCDALGYLVMYDPTWSQPEMTDYDRDPALRAWKKIQDQSVAQYPDDGHIYFGAGRAPSYIPS